MKGGQGGGGTEEAAWGGTEAGEQNAGSCKCGGDLEGEAES